MLKKQKQKSSLVKKPKGKIIAQKITATNSPSLYSQLRKQIRQEEKFLYLREKFPQQRITWEQAQNWRVSFSESQEINKRTNLSLRDIARERVTRTTEQRQKIAWSLRKQRAAIRKVRGKIDEEAYQKKLVERDQFQDPKPKTKLAQEQYWNKKFQANPISLAQAQLAKLRIQPDQPESNYKEAEKLAYHQRAKIPREVFDQPWLSHKETKTAKFGSIFSTGQLRRVDSVRQPLIGDKLKEYQAKINFYQLFGRSPNSEKEIRKFVSIDWEKEKDNYWILYGLNSVNLEDTKQKEQKRQKEFWEFQEFIKNNKGKLTPSEIAQRLDEINNRDRYALMIHPLNDELWAKTQRDIFLLGQHDSYWKIRGGNKEIANLPLFSQKVEHTKYFKLNQKYWMVDKKYLERDRIKLGNIKQKLSHRWAREITRIKSKYADWGLKSTGSGLDTRISLVQCSPLCNCVTNASCDPTGSEPACRTGYEFSADNHWGANYHPPLPPGQCPFVNTSPVGREEYGRPNRKVQCGNLPSLFGEKCHHDFDAWHKGSQGWGCHLEFPAVKSKKKRSQNILREW